MEIWCPLAVESEWVAWKSLHWKTQKLLLRSKHPAINVLLGILEDS